VGLCHRDLDAVRALVEARPTLAKAAIDWGFGDWETALGAASHVGRPDIAEFLMSHGARPDHFTFTMLGNLAALRAMIEARPELPGIHGPHGITLLQHAKNGGAANVVEYLEARGDADPRYRDDPFADEDKASMLGEYAFGDDAADVLVVGESMGGLAISRRGGVARRLFHLGEFTFHPAGATAVRVRFERTAAAWTQVHIADESIRVTGTRIVG
jgi:ankyrin repeat protein